MSKYDHLLPEYCYSVISSEEAVKITRNQLGYWKLPHGTYKNPYAFADRENAKLGVSEAQEKAMLNGCIFGWDLACADPQKYEISLDTPLAKKPERER